MTPYELEDETDLWALWSFDYFSSPTRMFDGWCKHCAYRTGKASRASALKSLTQHLVAKDWHGFAVLGKTEGEK